MSKQNYEAYDGNAPENYERHFVPAIAAPTRARGVSVGYVPNTPFADVNAKADDERRESLERDVVARWQEFVEGRSMMLRLRIVLATARKQ